MEVSGHLDAPVVLIRGKKMPIRYGRWPPEPVAKRRILPVSGIDPWSSIS